MAVVVVSEPSRPAFRAGWTAPPKGVEAVNSHGDRLEPFSNMVPLFVVELTAQFVASKGSQVACAINEKLHVGDIVFLG